jgi:hypothetical protein
MWKPLIGITQGQSETDNNNLMMQISNLASTYIRHERVVLFLSNWISLIPLTN